MQGRFTICKKLNPIEYWSPYTQEIIERVNNSNIYYTNSDDVTMSLRLIISLANNSIEISIESLLSCYYFDYFYFLFFLAFLVFLVFLVLLARFY